MEYPSVSMSIFLGPDLKGVRALISFLFEYMSKYEEKEKVGNDDLSNALVWKVQNEFKKWKAEGWLLPEFLGRIRDAYVTRIHLNISGELFSDELVEKKGKGTNSLISNCFEKAKAIKEAELVERRIHMEMREDNPEVKIKIDLMKKTFANFGKKIEVADKGRQLSIWEKKKLAKENLDKCLMDDDNPFLKKVMLERKKRKRPKRIRKRVAEQKEQTKEQVTTQAIAEEEQKKTEGEEKKEESKQETPMEAFQKKMDNLKQEKEKEINESQEAINKIESIAHKIF